MSKSKFDDSLILPGLFALAIGGFIATEAGWIGPFTETGKAEAEYEFAQEHAGYYEQCRAAKRAADAYLAAGNAEEYLKWDMQADLACSMRNLTQR